jgi:Ribbon-helix-helix protein, copG family.
LHALDEYARRMNMTRSDVIRMAIRQMLDKMRAAEEEEFDYIIVV